MNVVRSLPLVSPASQHAMYYGGSIATPAQLSLPIFSYREMPRKCAQHFPSFDAVLLEPVASGKQKLPWIATWAVRCRHQTQTEDFRMRWQIQRSSVPFPNLQQCCQTRQYASLPGRSHGSRVRKNTPTLWPTFWQSRRTAPRGSYPAWPESPLPNHQATGRRTRPGTCRRDDPEPI